MESNTPQIRLFGDPKSYNKNDTPTLSVSLTLHIELPRQSVERLPSFDVVPDFVDGWAFGETIGIFLRNYSPHQYTITDITINEERVGSSSCWRLS
jgi:hypothetical protein